MRSRFLWALLSLLVTTPQAGAVSVGRFGGAQGCGCHGLAPSPSTDVTIESEGPVGAGEETTLVVRIVETPIAAHPEHAHGGFNLVVADGEVVSLDPDVVRAEGREAGHRRLGNRQREWRVAWRAPDSPSACLIPIRAAVLAANGDESTTYDEWNLASTEVPIASDGDDQPPALAYVSPPPSAVSVGKLGLAVPAPLTIHVGSPVEIALRASDPSGIDALEVVDEGPTGEKRLGEPAYDPERGLFVLRWDTTGEPPGPHRLVATAADCAGNGPSRAVLELLILL